MRARLRAVAAASFLALEVTAAVAGPYAPAAGQPGSTAVAKDDPAIVAWASGWQDYVIGEALDPTWQTPERALGPAVGDAFDVVGLGRGGRITLTFDEPIVDGPGFDLAVFENAFSDTFLELAFVELSQDGEHFVRVSSRSLTASAIGAFGIVDPTDLDGLASKYVAGQGTPFDLASVGLSWATHVRLVDVVGDGSDLDSTGAPIYDPYPTVGSAGFDLDAVGVLHAGEILFVDGFEGGDDGAWFAVVER